MFVITIDGMAGCGKSSIAKGLSEKFGFKMLNTGAIYRGITCEYLKEYGNVPPNLQLMTPFVDSLDVEVVFNDKVQHVVVNGTDYTPFLREEIISTMTPPISGYAILREKVRGIQRNFAEQNDCVVEGRDIGNVVLKDADCKLFFTASSKVRAERRFAQMKDDPNCPSFDEILKDIEQRDEIDRTREHGTMAPAPDAIIVDNSNETYEQTLERCTQIVEEKLNNKKSQENSL